MFCSYQSATSNSTKVQGFKSIEEMQGYNKINQQVLARAQETVTETSSKPMETHGKCSRRVSHWSQTTSHLKHVSKTCQKHVENTCVCVCVKHVKQRCRHSCHVWASHSHLAMHGTRVHALPKPKNKTTEFCRQIVLQTDTNRYKPYS